MDTFDPKPDAVAEVRGEFRPIRTAVPGTLVCEHLPRLATLANRYTLIRSCSHDDPQHNTAAHAALTGHMHPRKGQMAPPTPDDCPPPGAVLTYRGVAPKGVPAWVTMPAVMNDSGIPFPAQNAGYLGRAYDPLALYTDPNSPAFSVEGLTLRTDLSPDRLADRIALLQRLDDTTRQGGHNDAGKVLEAAQRRALDLILSPTTRAAFRLDGEPDRVRDAYGRRPFGQCLLLARRLTEAGVPMVTVAFTSATPRRPGCNIAWDTHEDNFKDLKNKLLPDLDQALAALLQDLEQRGLFDQTLVVVTGEFGRTPRINKNAGRDHWQTVYSALWAGGGVCRGLVHGASDRNAAAPSTNPVSPGDLTASLYHALGIDPATELTDRLQRPRVLSPGRPILALFS